MPFAAKNARSGSTWSGWMLMMKRLGAPGGRLCCQLRRSSVRISVSVRSAMIPSASATTCMTVPSRWRRRPATPKRHADARPAHEREPRAARSHVSAHAATIAAIDQPSTV